jgi:hypothetical protein
MSMHEMKRMTQVGRRTWNALTNAEREAWYDNPWGEMFGFIEQIANILHIDISHWGTEDMEYIAARITR